MLVEVKKDKFTIVLEAREAENVFEAWIGMGAGKLGTGKTGKS